jgi:hypothetical protein
MDLSGQVYPRERGEIPTYTLSVISLPVFLGMVAVNYKWPCVPLLSGYIEMGNLQTLCAWGGVRRHRPPELSCLAIDYKGRVPKQ